MKTLSLLIMVCVLPIVANTQNKFTDYFPTQEGKIFYSDIIHVDSISKADLYKRAKTWLAYTQEAILYDEADKLVAKGFINHNLWFTVEIHIKDNKYKYKFTNFRLKSITSSEYSNEERYYPLEEPGVIFAFPKSKQMYAEQKDSLIKNLIDSLINSMSNSIEDNW